MHHTVARVDISDPFESLLVAHRDTLMRQAMRYTRSRAAAEDLVQETMLRALRFRHQFTMGTNFRAWVSTILTHAFIHGYRHNQREQSVLGGQTGMYAHHQGTIDAQASFYQRPDARVVSCAFGDEVTRAMANLPAEFRQVVALCDVEGQSYKAIAQQLGCPIGTVMSRLFRGRRLLGRQLGDFAHAQGFGRGKSWGTTLDPAHAVLAV